MALTSARRGFKKRLFVGRLAGTYGTGNALSSGVYVFDTLPNAPIRPQVATVTDKELATGVEFAQKQIPLEVSVNHTWQMWAGAESLATAFAFALGDDAVSGANPYTHAVTMAAAGTYPGAMTVQEHINGDTEDSTTDKRLIDLTVTEVSLSWGRTGMAQLSMTVQGSGRSAALKTSISGGPVNVYIPANKIQVYIAAAGTEGTSTWGGSFTGATSAGVPANESNISGEAKIGHLLESGKLTFRNVLEADRAAGMSTAAGIYGEQPEVVRREATFECKLIEDNTSDDFLYALLGSTQTDNAEYTIMIDWATDKVITSGHYYSGMIVLPLCMIRQTPDGDATLELAKDNIVFEAKKTYAGTSRDPIHVYFYDAQSGVYNA